MTSLLSAGLLAAALVGLFELAAFLRTQPGLPAWAGCLTGVAAAPLAWAAFARWGPLIPAASTWPVLVVAESFWLPPPCYAGSVALSLAGAAVTGGAARPATLGALALVAAGAGLPAWRHRVAAGAALTAAALTADGLLLGLPAGLEGALVALPVAAYVLAHRRRAEALRRARRAAEHDPVTDALTRAGLAEWRGQWRRPPSGSVVVLDPDDLRAVQETYGRATAEAVLAGAAFLLRHLLGPREVLARPAGDLLEVWSPAAQDSESARHLALRLHAAVSARPLPTPAGLVRCRWSAGWAAGALSEDLALEAERAAQAARLAGGGRVAGPPDAVPGPAAAGGPSWLVEAARALWQEWPVGAALTDPDGRVLTANPAFQARSGRSWPRLLGRALPEDLPLTPPQAVRVGDRLAAYWVTLAGAEAAPLLPAPAAALDWLARPGFAADPRWTVTPVFQAIVTLPAGQLLAFEALSLPVGTAVPWIPKPCSIRPPAWG
ncbi:membrane protein of unknown function [Candidatus Hydrogenisulfobacillus filiaventi]|uniref:GGDEF domain-containing protein n=1 Tax=Candidatus Hydrogenisulfobacillus filiaventi TaxID=2707344 RepID=A0A6F8ZE26_9FIRM|nr:membrane protein of unknown function [Candidatus Hydrogenisulfobacillus filiaventi]